MPEAEGVVVSLDVSTHRESFVAEVADIADRTGPVVHEDTATMIRRALGTHSIVLIRGMRLAPREQVGLTGLLGEIEPASDQRNHHPDSLDILVVHNTGATPVVGNRHWHSDRSFHVRPSRYTLLYGARVGSGGGETLFADMVAAYRQAPPSWRAGLAGAVGVHSYDRLARLRAEVHGRPIQADYATAFPPVRHPVVRAHPESGTPAFFLSELCLARIESEDGGPPDVSVGELHAHATRDRFVYRHQWRPDDVVIWDNARVLHRAGRLPAGSQRILHRTTTAGDRPRPAGPVADRR